MVLSFDRYSRDDVIGEVVCPLNGVDLQQIENQQIALSKEIQPRSLKVRLRFPSPFLHSRVKVAAEKLIEFFFSEQNKNTIRFVLKVVVNF